MSERWVFIRRCALAAGLLSLGGFGCSDPGTSGSEGSDQTSTGGSSAGQPGDAGGGGLSCDGSGAEPLHELRSDHDANDTYAVVLERPDGTTSVVFESFAPDHSSGRLLEVHRRDGQGWSPPAPFAPSAAAFVVGPTFADGFVYAMELSGFDVRPTVFRASQGDGSKQTVTMPGTSDIFAWPYVHFDGQTYWAATIADGERIVARSDDGLSFTRVSALGEARPQFSVHGFGAGGLAAVWQTGIDPQQVYVSLSSDGASWSPPRAASDVSINVHDGRFVKRRDGDLDLYYIAAMNDVAGFSVFRRHIALDGAMGPEERLTFAEDGNVNKPNPMRLDPCRVAVTVSLVSDPNPNAWKARAGLMTLESDAPRQ